MGKKPTPGNVSSADSMTSARRIRPRVGNERYSLAFVVAELSTLVEHLGHFPSRDEYILLGKGARSAVVRMVGLRNLAKRLGMKAKTGHGSTKKRDPSLFTCFNKEDCIASPPNRVDGKQRYCLECKKDRGWFS
jgi:hypothetical protein